MEQDLIQFTKNIAAQYPHLAYIFFFISASLQILFPPYPGDSVLIIEGYLSSRDYFPLSVIALNAVLSTFLSCVLLYSISYNTGDSIFKIRFISRYFSQKRIGLLKEWFKKYGALAIIASKFVPGAGSLTILVAGTFKVPRFKAYLSIALSSILHNGMLILIGKMAGDNMEYVKNYIKKYDEVVFLALFLICASYAYVRMFQKIRHFRDDF